MVRGDLRGLSWGDFNKTDFRTALSLCMLILLMQSKNTVRTVYYVLYHPLTMDELIELPDDMGSNTL